MHGIQKVVGSIPISSTSQPLEKSRGCGVSWATTACRCNPPRQPIEEQDPTEISCKPDAARAGAPNFPSRWMMNFRSLARGI
jgi:hypothetical protein